MTDDVDRQILEALQHNARTANADIARTVGMAPSAVLERVRKLEKRGLLKGYHARLEPSQVGLPMLAFVFVRTNERLAEEQTSHELAAVPEVQEVHHVAGEDCYLVKVRVPSPEALGRLLRESFGRIPAVLSTRSTVVLQTVKEDPRLPLHFLQGDDADA